MHDIRECAVIYARSKYTIQERAMADHNHHRQAKEVLDTVAQVNPYRRDQLNQKSEFYLFQMGFLAAYLASVFRDDPLRRRDFIRHIESLRYPKR